MKQPHSNQLIKLFIWKTKFLIKQNQKLSVNIYTNEIQIDNRYFQFIRRKTDGYLNRWISDRDSSLKAIIKTYNKYYN